MDTYITSIRTRLHRFKGQYVDIADTTGLGLSWLQKFSRGVIIEPGAEKARRLDAELLRREQTRGGGRQRAGRPHHPLRRATDQVLSAAEVRAETDPETTARTEGGALMLPGEG